MLLDPVFAFMHVFEHWRPIQSSRYCGEPLILCAMGMTNLCKLNFCGFKALSRDQVVVEGVHVLVLRFSGGIVSLYHTMAWHALAFFLHQLVHMIHGPAQNNALHVYMFVQVWRHYVVRLDITVGDAANDV